MITAKEALQRLIAGNKRYVAEALTASTRTDDEHRRAAASGQQPWAIILGCADSRVPVELLFDQALGDLFVVRVAGNIAAPTQTGSIEFAVQSWQTPLIVVLGHTHCGAVNATLATLKDADIEHSQALNTIVSAIRPAVEPLLAHADWSDSEDLFHQAVKANVEQSISQLLADSDLLRQRVADGALEVIGAQYDLATGQVTYYPS